MQETARTSEMIANARRPSGLVGQVRKDPPGVLDVPALPNLLLSIHIGGPTRVDCRRAGRHFSGTAVHGDIDIVPQQTPARWEIFSDTDRAVVLSLPSALLSAAADELAEAGRNVEFVNRFQIRDPVLESLGTAAGREIEDGCPSGGLYLDGIAAAAASRIVARHTSNSESTWPQTHALSGHRLKQILSYIEDRLGAEMTLSEIATAAGLSTSYLSTVFRKAMDLPVHQYVVRRRVERASILLQESTLPIADIALAVGFAHQSHMARHMVRILGITPRALRRSAK